MNKLRVNKWINRLFSRKCLILPEEWISLKNSCRQTGKQGSEVNSKLVIVGGFKNCRFGKAVIIFQSKSRWHLSSVTSPPTLLHHSALGQRKKSALAGKFYHEQWFDFFSVILIYCLRFSTYSLVYSVTPWLSLCKRMNTISLKNQSHQERLVPP